jgi:hypothetical protein
MLIPASTFSPFPFLGRVGLSHTCPTPAGGDQQPANPLLPCARGISSSVVAGARMRSRQSSWRSAASAMRRKSASILHRTQAHEQMTILSRLPPGDPCGTIRSLRRSCPDRFASSFSPSACS